MGSKKMRTTANTAFILAILTLGSKLLGFVREIFLANYYGTTYVVDAFTVATSIPGIIFAGILGAIATSYMPIYSQKVESEGQISGNLFTSQSINLLTTISLVSSLMGIFFSDQIVWIFANGFEGETAQLASFYVKITFSFTLFTAVAGIFDNYLKYNNIFISQTIAGYSISITAVMFVIISYHTSPHLLVFGTFTGNLIRFIILLILSKHAGYRYKPDFHITDTVKKIFYLAVPVFIGSTAGQINVFVNRALATRLPEGSAAAISYSDLLIGLVTGVTSTIIITIIYPKMTKAFAQDNISRLSSLYNSTLSILLIIGIPLSVAAMLYGKDIIQIMYERGTFDTNATDLTYWAFFFYSMGLLPMIVAPFVGQTCYSMHDTKTPLMLGVVGITVNIISNLILVHPLAHGGLALGNTLAAFTNAGLIIYFIHKKTTIVIESTLPGKILKIAFSTVTSLGMSYSFYHFGRNTIGLSHTTFMVIIIIIAIVIYLLLLKLFKFHELTYIKEIFHITHKSR